MNNLVQLTLDDNIDDIVADFLIERDVECFIRENKPLTATTYKQLSNIAAKCRKTIIYELAKNQNEFPQKWYTTSSRKFLEDILYRISVESIDEVAVTLRIAFPFFKDKYDKEYRVHQN